MTVRSRLVPALLAPVLGLVLNWPSTGTASPSPGRGGDRRPVLPAGRQRWHRRAALRRPRQLLVRLGRLSGRTRLEVRATQDLSRFDLDFLLPVRSVTVDGKKRRFRRSGDHELRHQARKADRQRHAVPRLRGVRRHPGQGHPAPREQLARQRHREVVAMNEPHMATWWFPANDHPRDKASFDIRITVLRSKDVIADGVLVGVEKRHGRTGPRTGARSSRWRPTSRSSRPATSRCGRRAATASPTSSRSPSTRRSFVRGESAKDLAERTCTTITALSNVLAPDLSAMGGVATSLPVSFALEDQTRPTYPVAAGPSQGLGGARSPHTSGSATPSRSATGATSGSTRASPSSCRPTTSTRWSVASR